MGKALIIGCGGVASVAIHKCCQNSDVFEEICIASRTKSKCDALKEKLSGGKTIIHTAQVNADNVDELIALIEQFKPDVVLNMGLPNQDLTLATKPNRWIPRTTSRLTPRNLNTNGSGITRSALKKRVSPRCSAAALTPA